MKHRNPVAKFLRKFNKTSIQRDKKKSVKAGYVKHKPIEEIKDDTTH